MTPMTASETLTPREREILGLLVLGLTNREIAAELHLSVRTVETHRANLQSKLQIRRRSGLVAYALAAQQPTS
jgi:DNA-binding NarL/FixJ family response regulator